MVSALSARDLAFGYRGHPVGRGVNLDLAPGRVLCLLGPNGSGKTTLFKTLLGLLPLQGGEVSIDGRRLRHLSRADIARRIAYVPQAHDAVFPYTVRDMVLMGRAVHRGLFAAPGREDFRQADAALETLGIAALADRDYTRISGGQRQLALIARALAQGSPLIIMDEPTASLDFGNQVLVLEQVQRLSRAGLGVVLSTHNPDHALACADQVLVLKDGAARAQGEPAGVLSSELLADIYEVDVEVRRLEGGYRVCVPPALLRSQHQE